MSDPDYTTALDLGTRLGHAIASSSVSARDIATAEGVHVSTVYRWIAGELPDAETYVRVLERCGWTVSLKRQPS